MENQVSRQIYTSEYINGSEIKWGMFVWVCVGGGIGHSLET